MQKKSLLVALFCGALCLTGCLKNEESASVAQVRIAKANELNSIADLNKAKAAAEAVYAQAELVVAQAEAKLREANAALVLAQAETEKVRAELLKVQVALEEVKVDEERVKLLELEAKLEQTLAEVEAAVAKAESEKQKYINEIEHQVALAEKQAIDDAKAILVAQDALQKYILTQEAEKADSAQAAGAKYFAALRQIQDLQLQSIETKATKALVEAGALQIRDAIHYGIDKIDEEIAKKETLLAYLKEYQEMTPEEAEAALLEARKKLTDAYNAYKAVAEVEDKAESALTDLKGMTADYLAGNWKTGENAFKDDFKEYVGDDWSRGESAVFYGDHAYIDGIQYFGVYVADEDKDPTNNAFIPLWTTLKENGQYKKWAAVKEDPKRYPDIDVYAAGDFIDLNNRTYVPAKIEFDNVKEVLDGLVAEFEDDIAADNKKFEEKTIPGFIESADEEIAEINDTLPLHQAYVNERQAAVTAAETAYLQAVSDAAASKDAKRAAWNAFQNYMVTKYDVSRALFETRWAMQEKDDDAAQDTTDANTNLALAEQALAQYQSELPAAIEAEAKAEGAYRKAVADEIEEEIIDAWNTAQRNYNPKFNPANKFAKFPNEHWNNVTAAGDSIPGTRALGKQITLAEKMVALENAKVTEAVELEKKWRGQTNTYAAAVVAREGAEEEVTTAQGQVNTSATNYAAAKSAYDTAAKAITDAKKAWNPDYSTNWGDKGPAYTTDHKYKKVTHGELTYKAWVDGDNHEAGTAQAARDTAWAKIRNAAAQLEVNHDYAWDATVPADATVAEIAKNKKNVSAHWANELKTANNALVAALGIKKIEDLDDTEAKALYAAYLAAKEEDKTAEARTALEKAYGLFNPDQIADYYKNHVDGKYGVRKDAQYSWLLSSYHVDYEAEMIDVTTNKFVPIASKLFPGENLKDFRGRDVLDENGKKLPNYAHSLAYQLERWNALKAETPEWIAEHKADNAEKLASFKEDIQELAAKVNSFKAHEATYLSWIESLNKGEAAVDKALKDEFDAKLVKDDAQAAYEALEAAANGYIWIYVGEEVGNEDGFINVPVNQAIEMLEGDIMEIKMQVAGTIAPFIMRAIMNSYKTPAAEEEIPLDDDDPEDVEGGVYGRLASAPGSFAVREGIRPTGFGFQSFNSIAGLTFTKALLEEALKVGKITLQVVLEAFDAELAVIDEEIALQTKVAAVYKAIMNGWLGIVDDEDVTGETGPLDGEGEGDDEE